MSFQEDCWRVPSCGWIKINCDGGFYSSAKRASIGVVVRNHDGKLIDDLNEIVKADCPIVAEATVVKMGVQIAVNSGYSNVIVETDSANLFTDVVGKGVKNWKFWSLVQEIRNYLNKIPNNQFRLIRRIANQATNWIAAQTIKGKCREDWVTHPPSSLVFILDKDGLPAPIDPLFSKEIEP
ncbi:hypothetical protein DITRI_Ditri05aG0130900 [Diplodiscus trichospermus]